jgi:ATP-binding protein involved in chromosome partitioning
MTQGPTERAVLAALQNVRDPDLGRDIVSLGFVKDLRVAGGDVAFAIELTTPACPVKDELKEDARRRVAALEGVKRVEVRTTSKVRPVPGPARERLIPYVKNVIPVASGKGGVGKSTVSANLALALARAGAAVGLLDADVYGPSIPGILGVREAPRKEGDRILPVACEGIRVLSTGFFVPENEAAIVRGPILHKLMEQFFADVEWGELDYLLVDLPPGTGDVQLSLCQMVPFTGAVIVSTPQDVALRVAQKAVLMFRKLNAPILGLVENMSYFKCGHCGAREEIFGSGGAKAWSERMNVPFLGEIPLATELRIASDAGRPPVTAAPDSEIARVFAGIAERLAAQVSIRNMAGAPDLKITF